MYKEFVISALYVSKLNLKSNPHGLYMPLFVPSMPWVDIFMDLFWDYLGQNVVMIQYL